MLRFPNPPGPCPDLPSSQFGIDADYFAGRAMAALFEPFAQTVLDRAVSAPTDKLPVAMPAAFRLPHA